MEFLHSLFLRSHFAGEPAVESRSISCFLKLLKIQANFMLVVTTDVSTHVQYTQPDTTRQTDGPLVPMVGLVPIEKDVIPMVLLVNMHLIKGTYITGQFPMVHWYQWYDWYQQKMMPFQWFYWCKTGSLLHQVKTR